MLVVQESELSTLSFLKVALMNKLMDRNSKVSNSWLSVHFIHAPDIRTSQFVWLPLPEQLAVSLVIIDVWLQAKDCLEKYTFWY